MKLVRLKLKNFLSFEKLDHSFVNGPVLIQGRNLTEPESKETNGSGKSTIEAAISYAIMATPMRKGVLDRDLIRWGEQEAEIFLSIYCPVRKQTLTIFRKLSVKGSAKLLLHIIPDDFSEQEGKEISFATVNDGNRYILNWIGISSEDLRNYFILNKENYKSFITASNTDKLALINRFIKVDRLDRADEVINDEVKPLQSQLSDALSRMNRIDGQITAYNEQLQSERERNIDEERQSIIEGIESQIETVLSKYEAATNRIEDCKRLMKLQYGVIDEKKAAIAAATAELESINKEDWKGEVDRIAEKRMAVTKDNAVVQMEDNGLFTHYCAVEKKLLRLNSLLKGKIVCPNCKHEFILDSDMTIPEIEKEVRDVAAEKEELLKKRAECEVRKNEFNTQLRELTAKLEEFRKKESLSLEQVRKVESSIIHLKSAVTTAEAEIKRYLSEIESLTLSMDAYDKESEMLAVQLEKAQSATIETREAEIEGTLTLLGKQRDKVQKEIDEVNDCISAMQQWGQRFKEFKMSLACEQLKLIQDAANLSLQRQHSELRLSIDGFKVNAKGQVKSEITVLVINAEGEYKSFWSFSGGERARMEMALIQAFQEMINATNPYGGLHFLMIDEVLEGTDPLGLALLLESIHDIESPVYVISHVMNMRAGINTMTIVKDGGCSYIEMKE